MVDQQTFGPPKIANPGEPHLACVLLLDTSGSMGGAPIESLNKALQNFKEKLSMDEMAQKRVDVAIVEFNSNASLVQDFTPISMMQPIELSVTGSTAMSKGIHMAIDLVKQRNRFYNELGTPVYKPWIFMITDGAPDSDDDIESARLRIQEEETKGTHGKLKFFALGVPGFERNILIELTRHQGEKPRIMELENFDFAGIFNWISESMVAISVSRVGDEVALPRLPDNAKRIDPKDTTGW